MDAFKRIILLVVAVVFICSASVHARPGEMRGIWCHSAYGVQGYTWDETVKKLSEGGFNALFMNACWADMADYDSNVLYVSPEVAKQGDQIAKCLEACRKYGVQLHIWKVCWNLGPGYPKDKLAKMQTAGRTQKSRDGEDCTFLAPHQQKNLQQELDVIREIARKYNVDGIHLDYVRYNSSRYDYSDSARTAYEQARNIKVQEWPKDCLAGGVNFEDFCNWRCDNISALVRDARTVIKQENPSIKLSVAIYPEWDHSPEWIGQDARKWIENGWVDFVCPMNYTTDDKQLEIWLKSQYSFNQCKVPWYPGIALYKMKEPNQAKRQIQLAAEQGSDGFMCFALKPVFFEQFLPAIKADISSERTTLLPHESLPISWNIGAGDEDILGDYREKANIALNVNLPSHVAQDDLRVSVELNGFDCKGRGITAQFTEHGIKIALATWKSGRYRVRIQDKKYVWRSPIMRVLNAEEVADVLLHNGPPQFKNNGKIRVAVWDDNAYGAKPIIEALSSNGAYDVAVLYNTKQENLKNCQVIVLPQVRFGVKRFQSEETADVFRKYVEQGGSLMVTHAMVGTRSFPVLFPNIVGAVEQQAIPEKKWRIVKNKITKKISKKEQTSTFVDMIAMTPGKNGSIVLKSATGKCVMLSGNAGKGRFVACGLGLGIGAQDANVSLHDTEKQLLFNTINWLGTK